MNVTAQSPRASTPCLEGSEPSTPQETKPRLSLVPPGGRKRTDEDKAWYTDQLRIEHSKLLDKVVYERIAYYASLNPQRDAFPSVARVAREVLCSVRTVQYALRRLEAAGLIQCLSRAGGRATAHYRVAGLTDCRAGVQEVHPWGARGAPEDLSRSRKGKEGQNLNLDLLTCEAQVGGAKPTTPPKELEPTKSLGLPSQDPGQEQEKASAPVAKEPKFENQKQISTLFALQRKLGYEANDEQAVVFDGLEHVDKKRIIDKLEAEEQRRAIRGEVANPPPKAPAPRHTPLERPTPTPTRERTACAQHRWSVPASDGVSQCNVCGEERGEIRVVLGGVR